MDQPFIAQIMMWAGTFAPRGWADCHGQLMSIASNTAMFSLVGTNYGGDGRTTFGLPDMRSRTPMGDGQGPGLSLRRLGQKGGDETVTLNVTQMPSHSHSAQTVSVKMPASNQPGNATDPTGGYPAAANISQRGGGDITGQIYSNSSNQTMGDASVSGNVTNSGGNQGHPNMPPFEVVKFVIALQGLYPSRN